MSFLDSSHLFFLVPEGNGYYQPRYPCSAQSETSQEENPGISIAERDAETIRTINKLRSLKHISRFE